MTAPGQPLLVFDGDCGFCTTSANAARRWLGLEHVEPWQLLDLGSLGLTEEACAEAVQWVAADGRVSTAERAVVEALRHAGGLWRVPAAVLAFPGIRWTAGAAYRLVARNRYRLPGATAACRVDGR